MLLAATLLVMVMMSYFGFRLKGFRLQNKAQWSDSGIGLNFRRYAIAYTKGFFSAADNGSESGLTIECAIAPGFSINSGFKFLLLVHDGRDERQLVLGQWRSSLIAMNGDDYSHRQRVPRIAVQMDDRVEKVQLLTLVSSSSGTVIYLDGRLVKRNNNLVLTYPDKPGSARLVVGNNLHGNGPWQGSIRGLAMYDHPLPDAIVLAHHQLWERDQSFDGFNVDAPQILYTFQQGKGRAVHNQMGQGPELLIPERMTDLAKKVLSWPRLDPSTMASLVNDVVTNLVGFIPLGVMLTATLSLLKGVRRSGVWGLVVVICLSFSLTIEIFQIWLPSRDSSSLDLILNTIGGGLGIVVFYFFRWFVNDGSAVQG